MKFFSLFVVGIVALSFSACEKQPYSKLELMESPFRHEHPVEGEGHGHKKEADSKGEAKGHEKAAEAAAE